MRAVTSIPSRRFGSRFIRDLPEYDGISSPARLFWLPQYKSSLLFSGRLQLHRLVDDWSTRYRYWTFTPSTGSGVVGDCVHTDARHRCCREGALLQRVTDAQ